MKKNVIEMSEIIINFPLLIWNIVEISHKGGIQNVIYLVLLFIIVVGYCCNHKERIHELPNKSSEKETITLENEFAGVSFLATAGYFLAIIFKIILEKLN